MRVGQVSSPQAAAPGAKRSPSESEEPQASFVSMDSSATESAMAASSSTGALFVNDALLLAEVMKEDGLLLVPNFCGTDAFLIRPPSSSEVDGSAPVGLDSGCRRE